MRSAAPGTAVSGVQNEPGSWVWGVLAGLRAFAFIAALGLGIGLAEYAASGGAYRLLTWLKVGALYLVSFFGVGVRVDVGGTELFLLRLPLLTGTALAGWVLFRAGRAADGRSGWSAAWVVAGFVIPIWAVALPARLLFPDLGGRGVDATVAAIAWQVLLLPTVFSAAAVFAGLWSTRTARSPGTAAVRSVIAGGWRAAWLAVVFAFAGLLVVAALHPGRAQEYGRWLGSQGRGGTLLVGHELLAAPNAAIFVLVPSIGGTTTLTGSGAPPASVRMSGIDPVGFIPPGFPGHRFGGMFLLFLVVPAIATILGGRFAATAANSAGGRFTRGVGAGLVFVTVITVASWLASVSSPLSRAASPIHVSVGLGTTAILAAAWGVGGGVLGACSAQVVGAEPAAGVEPPLKPTSA